MHTPPKDFWDGLDRCIVCHRLSPSCCLCRLLQFFCLSVFFFRTRRGCVTTTLSFYPPPKTIQPSSLSEWNKGRRCPYMCHTIEIFLCNPIDDLVEQLESTYRRCTLMFFQTFLSLQFTTRCNQHFLSTHHLNYSASESFRME